MRRHSFFRKGEIVKWLEAYRRSREYVRIYKYYLSEEQKLLQREEFIEADRIVREYQILQCSLNDTDKELLERYLSRGEADDERQIWRSPDIIENWEMIVLSSGKHSFEPFDPVAFGKKLKEFREHNGFYRAEAAQMPRRSVRDPAIFILMMKTQSFTAIAAAF